MKPLLKKLMTTTTNDYTQFLAAKQEILQLRSARTRCWGAWLKCLGLGVFGSIWQSAVTGNWKPTGIATVVAVPCLVLTPVDMGTTLMFAPPITAAAMFTSAATKARNKYQFHAPEQADAALAVKGIF